MNKIRRLLFLIFFANIAITSSAQKAPETQIEKLQYMRTIELPNREENKLYSFPLDKAIYKHSKGAAANFCDLRIIAKEQSSEIPYRISKKHTTKIESVKQNCSSQIISLKKLKNNSIEIIIKNQEKRLNATIMTIHTTMHNFDKQISITPGDESGQWETEHTVTSSIFDYSAIIPLSNRTVKLPLTNKKFYRILISNFAEKKLANRMEIIKEQRSGKNFSEIHKIIKSSAPFKIEEIKLQAIVTKTLPKQNVNEEVENRIISTATEKRNTEIIIDTFHQPVTTIKLSTASTNFIRKTDIYTSNDRKKWIYRNRVEISSISIDNFQRESLNIHIPESHDKFIKLSIHNNDAPPIRDINIKTFASVYILQFLLSSHTLTPKLYYGGNIPPPLYDIDKIIAKLANPKFITVTLGPEAPNPSYITQQETTNSLINSKILLYCIIAAMVILLSLALFKTMNTPELRD